MISSSSVDVIFERHYVCVAMWVMNGRCVSAASGTAGKHACLMWHDFFVSQAQRIDTVKTAVEACVLVCYRTGRKT